MSPKYNAKVAKLPKSEVEISAELSTEVLDKGKRKALDKLSNSLDIPGFRKGKIPENIIMGHVGEAHILQDAAEISINEHWPLILEELNLEPIGRPQLQISKMAFGNPLSFKVKTSLLPQFDLPDYKKIVENLKKEKSKDEKIEATDKEVDDVLLQIRKNKAHHDWHRAHEGRDPELVEGHDHPNFDDEKNLPIIDDEFIKLVGNFKDVSELREKIKENIVEDKKFKEIEKNRALMMEELIKETPMELPYILVESEIEKTLAQMKDDVARAGLKFEDYLTQIKKSEDEVRKGLREDSEKKAKIQLIFNKIAEVEKLSPNKEVVDHEVKKILEMYPGASETNARIYVSTQLLNAEVIKLLEK